MLVSEDVSPDTSLYYLGGKLISLIDQQNEQLDFLELFEVMRKRYGISIKLFILTLDWLYLLGLIELTDDGDFRKCF